MHITVAEVRWVRQRGRVRWRDVAEGAYRREQVVTIQTLVIDRLPASVRSAMFPADGYCEIRPTGRESPRELGFPRNVGIRKLEDRLLDLAHAQRLRLVAQRIDPALTRLFAGRNSVRARDRLHQSVVLHWLVEIDRRAGWHVEDGDPHGADEDQSRLPTSWSMASSGTDEFTARMQEAINGMMLDMIAAIARKDYDDRRRQAQGIQKAKQEGRYRERPEDQERNAAIVKMLKAGQSWNNIVAATGASRSTLARLAKRSHLALPSPRHT
ncbi:hypothetical protein MESS2_10053 [Mesorhizobium metallidurans STM 2683]|uniref:Resolvase n=1 Tax=Mesorhizobium metallidurans STM 2683 TaxID=1297569 RepID=M5EF54_9HYPH|nr:hypothetical protein MESS2_10053 [Mesorhizobium metallidurans STM 2683]